MSATLKDTTNADVPCDMGGAYTASGGGSQSMLYLGQTTGQVHRYNVETGVLTYVTGTGGGGSTGALSGVQFSQLNGMSVASDTLVYVTDNLQVYAIDTSAGQVESIAGRAGTSSVVDGVGTVAEFKQAGDLAYHGSGGTIYVADTTGYSIRAIQASTKQTTTVVGQSGVQASRDGIGTTAVIYRPGAVSTSGSDLYFSDERASGTAIRRLDINSMEVVSVVQAGGALADGPLSSVGLQNPISMRVDAAVTSIIYAAEQTTGKVRVIDLSRSASFTAAESLAIPRAAFVGTAEPRKTLFVCDSGTQLLQYTPAVTQSPTRSPTLGPTFSPTSASPVTVVPTTREPVTSSPSSQSPTLSPLTASPTTVAPTVGPTELPTTMSPTSDSPTMAPTLTPVDPPNLDVLATELLSSAQDTYIQVEIGPSNRTSKLGVHEMLWNVSNANTGERIVFDNMRSTGLLVRAGTLIPGQRYTFHFMIVYEQISSVGASILSDFHAEIEREVKVTPLAAEIIGGTRRDVLASVGTVVDASESHDPDQVVGTTVDTWSCRTRDFNTTVAFGACPTALPAAVNRQVIIPANWLLPGKEYLFTFAFEVSIPSLTRSANASVLITGTFDPIPIVEISPGTNGLRVSYGKEIQLVASARPDPRSHATVDTLQYDWTEVSQGISIGTQGATSLVLDTATLGLFQAGISYEFQVSVYDKDVWVGLVRGTTGIARIAVDVVPVPEARNMTVSPLFGFAFVQYFSMVADATGEQPLLYRYSFTRSNTSVFASVSDTMLSSFKGQSTLNVTLPEGNLTVNVEVMDAVGGITRLSAPQQVVVVRDPRLVDQEDTRQTTDYSLECQRANLSISIMRNILRSASGKFNDRTDPLGLCDAARSEILDLIANGKYDRALLTILYLRAQIDLIPQASVSIAERCDASIEIFGVRPSTTLPTLQVSNTSGCMVDNGNLTVRGSASGPTLGSLAAATLDEGVVTMRSLSVSVWVTLLNFVKSIVFDPSTGQRTGAQAMQVLGFHAVSPAANMSTESLQELTQTAAQLIDYVSPADLLFRGMGQQTADAIAGIIDLANETFYKQPMPDFAVSDDVVDRYKMYLNEQCAESDRATELLARLQEQTALGLVPGSSAIEYETSRFTATTRSVFADGTSSFAIGGSGASVVVPPSSKSESEIRPRAALSITTWPWELSQACRRDRENRLIKTLVAQIASGITGVTITPQPTPGANRSADNRSDTYFEDGGVMSLFIPMQSRMQECSGGSAAGSPVITTCEYWDTSSGLWNYTNCEFVRFVNDTVAECKCRHLTEFAVLQRRRTCEPTNPWSARVYGTFIALYSVVFVYCAYQTGIFLWWKLRMWPVGYSYLLMTTHAFARIWSSLLYSEVLPSFSVSTADPGLVLFFTAMPYSVAFWSVSLLFFQWLSIVRNKLSRNPFLQVQGAYIGWNAGIIVVAWVTFAIALYANVPNVLEVGSIVFASIGLATVVCVLVYGHLIADTIRNTRSGTKRAVKLKSAARRIGLVFGIQSAAWIASAFVGSSIVLLYALSAVFLAADVSAIVVLCIVYREGTKAFLQKAMNSRSGKARRAQMPRSERRGVSSLNLRESETKMMDELKSSYTIEMSSTKASRRGVNSRRFAYLQQQTAEIRILKKEGDMKRTGDDEDADIGGQRSRSRSPSPVITRRRRLERTNLGKNVHESYLTSQLGLIESRARRNARRSDDMLGSWTASSFDNSKSESSAGDKDRVVL